jgi:thioredoxin-related protein
MRRAVIISILLIASVFQAWAQADTNQKIAQTHGVAFINNTSWTELLQKAKAENKYIFVDCYATWCGPCKWMDKHVYTNDSVGAYMDAKFISVRIQMDSTEKDNEYVRHWYTNAHEIKQKYQIAAYPCYLFFSPEGNAVDKCVGALGINDFLSLASSAMDSKKQYYTLLTCYRNGEKDYSHMSILLKAARRAGELKASNEVALDYLHNYLDKLPENSKWTEEKIGLIDLYLDCIGCDDKIFALYYRNRKLIDSVMNNPDYADTRINFIIYREKIKPILDKMKKSGEKPGWTRIENEIAKAYGLHYAKINILEGLVKYNNFIKDWHQYVKYFIQLKEEQGIENLQPTTELNRVTLNNQAYEVFQYGNNRQLRKALSWVDRALSAQNSYFDAIDTKANILYKLGRKEEGLALEEQAYALVPKGSLSYADIQENFDKMKNNQPTWVWPPK